MEHKLIKNTQTIGDAVFELKRYCYVWTTESTELNTPVTSDEDDSLLEEQQRINEELEYLNSWDRLLDFI